MRLAIAPSLARSVLLAAALVGAASQVAAQARDTTSPGGALWDITGNTVPMSGMVATPGCGGVLYGDVEGGELTIIQVPPGGQTLDMLFDLRTHGGRSMGGADVGSMTSPVWRAPYNFRWPPTASNVFFAYVTYPPARGTRGGRLGVDSGTVANQDFTAVPVQTVGESIPSSYPRTQGIDLALPSDGSSYGVKLRGPAGPLTSGFPKGATGGIEVAFSPIVEVNTVDLIGGGCSVAGEAADPSDPTRTRGIIAGYNVYRLVGDASYVPTSQDFLDASLDGDPSTGWQAYLPLDGGFDLRRRDGNPGGPGTAAPSDLAANDLVGFQNPDGVMYSGDEVLLYQDSSNNRGVPRTTGTPPDVSGATSYWYAVQPVLRGSLADFASLGFGPGSSLFFGDHRLDLDGDGSADAIDLDLDGTPDFISPQAEAGLRGLGLTNAHLPLLSAPVLGRANPLVSHGCAQIGARAFDGGIEVTVVGDAEAADVVGYVVDRVEEGAIPPCRVRVNDQPILSGGGEGEVYALVDTLAVVACRHTVRYELSAIHVDGTTETIASVALAPGHVGRRAR